MNKIVLVLVDDSPSVHRQITQEIDNFNSDLHDQLRIVTFNSGGDAISWLGGLQYDERVIMVGDWQMPAGKAFVISQAFTLSGVYGYPLIFIGFTAHKENAELGIKKLSLPKGVVVIEKDSTGPEKVVTEIKKAIKELEKVDS